MTDNSRAALLMMAGQAAFVVNDACMKALSDELPLFQAIFLRGVATSLCLILLARAMGALRLDLSRRDWTFVGLRTVGEIAAAYLFISALFNMPLANATAILQALPLALTLAGAVFLRERVGWRRLLAILVGFLGVMLIIRPGPDGFNVYSFYALASVGCVTLRDLSTRQLSRDVPSLTVAVAAAVAVTVFAGVGSIWDEWRPVSQTAVLQLSGAVVFVFLGYLMSVMVMRAGDLGFVAPFRYTAMVWALILGYTVFGDWPDPLTFLGAAVVAATGIFTLYRERQLARKRSAAA